MPQSPETIGRIIIMAGELETQLRLSGGNGIGLRELSDSLSGKLSPEAMQLFRYIIAVRNVCAHQGDTDAMADFDMDVFAEACAAVTEELEMLPARRRPPNTETGREEACAAPPPEPITDTSPETIELPNNDIPYELPEDSEPPAPGERPKLRRLAALMTATEESDASGTAENTAPSAENTAVNWLAIAAIPGIHLIYPLQMLVAGLAGAYWRIFILLAYVVGIPVICDGLERGWRELVWTGIGLLLLGYIGALISGISVMRTLERGMHWSVFCPVLNICYCLLQIWQKMDKMLLAGGGALLLVAYAAWYLISVHQEYTAGTIIALGGFAGGIISAWLLRRAS